ncbi:ArsR family transcriptional regulator [Caldicellulosiruptor changbaiensis]|uniref:ArsR family transcriptional regulator n=1 Tax=Caldicellulosiruptor changbaiensis TaxID=1222016 RepID=A0A3T0D6I5_9FIRM|nr:metalloregulator ArsR/SmtB family transcription factor [Caldicellulosiruptor changbaiensis]AZT90643.1 ArsR family transcriptional regulator [Caldicellulosiruptor changbaiensis]
MEERIYKRISEYFKALSHPTRIKIIELLAKSEMCVCEMMAKLQLDQSHISRHLIILKSNGMVEDRREGNRVFYRVVDKNVIEIVEKIKEKF